MSAKTAGMNEGMKKRNYTPLSTYV